MKLWDEYFIPDSIQEALSYLHAADGKGRIIGGGTDLIPQIRNGKKEARCLVDVTRIPDMARIEFNSSVVSIGGAVTHSQVVSSGVIRRVAEVLAEASGSVGSPQIRNQGTLAGNIVSAQPAADGAVALIALDAEAVVKSWKGVRVSPLIDLYLGIGESALYSSCEVMTQIRFRALDGSRQEASAFERLAIRKTLALPIINVAVCLKVKDGRFEWVRMAIGPVASTPFRAFDVEAEMKGVPADEVAISIAASRASEAATPRDSKLRGSQEYRKQMVQILVRRALQKALTRATATS